MTPDDSGSQPPHRRPIPGVEVAGRLRRMDAREGKRGHGGCRDRHRKRERSPESYSRSPSRTPPASSSGSARRHRRSQHERSRRGEESPRYHRQFDRRPSRSRSQSKSPPCSRPAPHSPPSASLPNFQQSGALYREQNTYKGVVLKYVEPAEAMKPTKKWRLHVFKDEEQVDLVEVHSQSGYLIGRSQSICDMPLLHPSISVQHAVLQFRSLKLADKRTVIRPYIIDLESANGTFLNGDKLEARRYVQIKAGDVLKFGFSSRDYVLMHEGLA